MEDLKKEEINEESILNDDVSLVKDEEENVNPVDEIIEDDNKALVETVDAIDDIVAVDKKAKKEKKLRKKYSIDGDIKYRGPFSYRYLRIFAWIAIACGQALVINEFSGNILEGKVLSNWVDTLFTFISTLSVPLFIIATFSTILNKSKSIKQVIIFYAFAYFGFALSLIILYYRYIDDLLSKLGVSEELISAVGDTIETKVGINVFSDLLVLSVFYFFIMYDPKNHFKDKKIIIFRLLSIVHLLVALTSYIIKILNRYDVLDIPFALAPFLTTKPPFIYVLFISLVLWLKHRERKFIKLGGTKEQFEMFENSNRNSLAFSIFICILCFAIATIDTAFFLIPFFTENISLILFVLATEFGQCVGLFFAIPILMLFSYSRKHKQSSADIIIVLSGVGMIAFTYIELIYEIVVRIAAQSV